MLRDASIVTATGLFSCDDVAWPPSPPLPATAPPATVVMMACTVDKAAAAAGFCAVVKVISLVRTVFDISVGVALNENKITYVID